MNTSRGRPRIPDLSLTPLRQRVLDLVGEAKAPVKAYDLLDVLRRERGSAAPTMVYRALAHLQQLGLVHRLESLNAYVRVRSLAPGKAVAFLICADCADASAVEDIAMVGALSMLAAARGFSTRTHVVELLGTCRRCREDAR